MPSRTSVVSENMTVAPARTSRSVQTPTAGLAVTPEKASLPPHCTPTTRADAGTVSRRRAFSRSRCTVAEARIESIIEAKPTCAVVLQADDVERRVVAVALVADREAARRQQALRLQLLAAQAHHHHLAAEVRVLG